MFPARTSLVHTHRRPEHCYVLTEGILIRELQLDCGRRQIVGLHVPGDVCGLSVLADRRAAHDMVALTPVSCVCVDHQWLATSARGATDLLDAIWREMQLEAAISAAWTVNIGQRSAYKRMAHLLCEICERLRISGHDTSIGFEWPGTQADLGAATGLSLVHVNRTLRRLEEEHVISCGRHIVLHDVAKLSAIAGFDPGYLVLDKERLGRMLMSRIEIGAEHAVAGRDGLPLPDIEARLPMKV